MANKLKAVFSNNKYEMGGMIRFRDAAAKAEFERKLAILYEEGRPEEIEGIRSISTTIQDGDMKYPYMVDTDVDRFMIYPSIEEEKITVDTKYGERTLALEKLYTKNGMILRTGEQSVAFLQFRFSLDAEQVQLSYRMQLQYASSAQAVAEEFAVALGILDKFFSAGDGPDEDDTVSHMQAVFKKVSAVFEQISQIGQELHMDFDPKKISDLGEEFLDIEELYVLLVLKKPVRLRARLTSTESTGVTFHPGADIPEKGKEIGLTFTGTTKYVICGEEITIYTSNILFNAVIQDIVDLPDGSVKVLYADRDSQPMYISFRGFSDEESAKAEQGMYLEHREEYMHAGIVQDYLGG